ncbi:hypothetical protein SAMN05421630_101825 [Prauserella marina]|uniref:Uncharacterized protein n=1 Tax=Prauserella marina TaxID=530584 RepID=A0A1G6JRK0_9PSEU|nr:hypothetical protein [Prauserella marina]PWV84494.1 hypothetical protein DES30_101511 [Prauserella marina]SDC21055.1 hypothetical protein SAMN05421630_101825 [Prauserella marina]
MTAQRQFRRGVIPLALVLLAGCGGTNDTAEDPAAKEETPHGYVEGAEETAEAQSRLVVADEETGQVRVLDLVGEHEWPIELPVDSVEGLMGDGRFGYVVAGGAVHIVDSGSWMVDHGDHVHYYRSEPSAAGSVELAAPSAVFSGPVITSVSSAEGPATLLDTSALEEGNAESAGALGEGGEAAVVPFGEHLLVPATREGAGVIEVRRQGGEIVDTLAEPCHDPGGVAVTRLGVVFGCQDGALLVSESKETVRGDKIGYPEQVGEADRAREFQHRPGSTTLVARAGDTAVWVLDAAARTWARVETGPVTAANTAGEGAPLLTLTAEGVLRAHDIDSGTETATARLLEKPDPRATILVDTSRAYVNDPRAGVVHEIDYNDDVRVARTLSVDIAPTHIVETGR